MMFFLWSVALKRHAELKRIRIFSQRLTSEPKADVV
jgi:hypothetical protein